MPQLLIEEPIIDHKLTILNESKLYDFDTVKFVARLMEADVVNRNKRIYPREVLEKAIDTFVKPRLPEKTFGGELDHPLPQGNSSDILRQQTLSYRYMSHVITDIWWEGNSVFGVEGTGWAFGDEVLALR